MKKLSNVQTWEALQADYTLEFVQKAIAQYEHSKEYHRKHNLKVKLILARAKEAGITG